MEYYDLKSKMAIFYKLDRFCDSRGWSLNDVFNKVPHVEVFQINYSVIYPGAIKAWHRHKHQDDYFCVLSGMAKVGVYTKEEGLEEYYTGEHNPGVVHISSGEWHGITALGTSPCHLLYFVTNKYNPHKPDEERAPWDSFDSGDWWKVENK